MVERSSNEILTEMERAKRSNDPQKVLSLYEECLTALKREGDPLLARVTPEAMGKDPLYLGLASMYTALANAGRGMEPEAAADRLEGAQDLILQAVQGRRREGKKSAPRTTQPRTRKRQQAPRGKR